MAHQRVSLSTHFWRLCLLGLFCYALIHSAQSTRDAALTVKIFDAATGRPTPVRVRLQDSQGNRPRVSGAVALSEIRHPDSQTGPARHVGPQDRAAGLRRFSPTGPSTWTAASTFACRPAPIRWPFPRAPSTSQQTETLALKPGAERQRASTGSKRWIDMPARGWYSSDDHIHLQRSPRDDPSILRWIAAEDIHVGHILRNGRFLGHLFQPVLLRRKGTLPRGRPHPFAGSGRAAHAGNRPHHLAGSTGIGALPATIITPSAGSSTASTNWAASPALPTRV